MNISKKQDGSTLTLALEGRLDTGTAPELEAVIDSTPADIAALVIDMTALEYISSAGLRVLLKAQKMVNAASHTMKLTHVNETIMEILDITGFVDILTIE